MNAFATAQHFFETPDEDLEADAYEAFIESWEPTEADYAHAVDAMWDVPAAVAALGADFSVGQGRFVDIDEVAGNAYSEAYAMGGNLEEGCANQRRLAALLGRAIEAAGDKSRPFLTAQLRLLAERDWESEKDAEPDYDGWEDF